MYQKEKSQSILISTWKFYQKGALLGDFTTVTWVTVKGALLGDFTAVTGVTVKGALLGDFTAVTGVTVTNWLTDRLAELIYKIGFHLQY